MGKPEQLTFANQNLVTELQNVEHQFHKINGLIISSIQKAKKDDDKQQLKTLSALVDGLRVDIEANSKRLTELEYNLKTKIGSMLC